MKNRRLNRAFTLIEILVVVAIIGIVLSIAVLSLGILGDDRELREEARRLSTLVEVAQDEATMQGREFGIEFMSIGFRFVEFEPYLNVWSELVGDDTLRERRLPDGIEFELWIEGQSVVLNAEPAEFKSREGSAAASSAASYAPHVMVFSSGDMTPFEIHLRRPDLDQVVMLQGDILGDVRFVDPEAQ